MQVRRDVPPISLSLSTWIHTVYSGITAKDVWSHISSLSILTMLNLIGDASVDRTSQI